jgi:hypothetical protein
MKYGSNFYMGHFVTLKVVTEAIDGYRKFLRNASQDQGRPYSYEARARNDAKEVLGRHAALWWQFNRRGGWVRGAVHGS